MSIVKILNRDYQIACGEGEEQKLQELAGKLDKRLRDVSRLFKGANENMIIVVTAIMLEDLVNDLQKQNELLQKQVGKQIPQNSSSEYLDSVADRIEKIYTSLSSVE